MTKQIFHETIKKLERVYDPSEARSIAKLLFEDGFGVYAPELALQEMTNIDPAILHECTTRLINNEPIQYITGVADFYGRTFDIRPGVFIPRPETEELVSLVLQEKRASNLAILEVGVGSGCIAVTLAVEVGREVYGTDISDEAISLTQKNATTLKGPTHLMSHDILSSNLPLSNLDVLVSNPPYIPKKERIWMRDNVLCFEPESALFVPDEDPLVFYKRIAEAGKQSLKKGGKVYVEIHEKFGVEVVNCFHALGYLHTKIHRDMQGKDRIVSAVNPSE